MAFFSWCRLVLLEQRLKFGEFGKYNWYRCLCLKRYAKSADEKLSIAQEVLAGPSVNTMAAQANEAFLRRHRQSHEQTPEPGRTSPAQVSPAGDSSHTHEPTR